MEDSKELAVNPEEAAALALASEMEEMFGESAPDDSTPLSFNNYGIMRATAQFEIVKDEVFEKTLTGHILYKHCAKQYFVGEFDPSNPSAPVCYSINGVKPAEGCEEVQCNSFCCDCEHSKYGTATKGEGKACKDTIRFLFLPEGSVLPITIIAPPTSLSKKGPLQNWLNSVMDDVAKAMTAAGKSNNKGGPIVDYWWAKVQLSLEKKTFPGGEASILKVKTLDVVTPETAEGMAAARSIHQARKSFNDVYINELSSHVEQANSDESPSQPVTDDIPDGPFNPDEVIPE